MKTEEIKKILSLYINPELLIQVQEEKIPDSAIFKQSLFIAMKKRNPHLHIQFPWQLIALGSGLMNYRAPIDWKQIDNVGASPGHYVAWSGNKEQLIWALTQDKDILTIKDYFGATIAHYAAWSGNPAILEWVLTQDNDALTRQDNNGHTIMHYAAGLDNLAILEWILTQDNDALTRQDNNGRTIAHYAAGLGNLAILEWVLTQDNDALTRQDNEGRTIVHYATEPGNPVILKYLLQQDNDSLTRQDNEGRTIAHYAAGLGNPAILEWVLTQDNDSLTRQDNEGRTIVHYAARSDNITILKLVSTQDRDTLTRKDNEGRTIAHYAARLGYYDTLKWMLIQDEDVLTRQDNNGCTIAHYAFMSGNSAILKLVLTQGKYVLTIQDDLGRTVAHYAARSGNPAILEWILTQDNDALTRQDNEGRTITHYAAWSGNPAILEWILTRDNDALTRQDNEGRTIAHYAAQSGESEILRYLFRTYPTLTKQAWVQDKNGDMPNALAPASMIPKPYQILYESLLEATNRVMHGLKQANDLILLDSFQDEWQVLLVKEEHLSAQNLIENRLRFPRPLQNIINILLPTLKIKAFSLPDNTVTPEQLKTLIALIPPIPQSQSQYRLVQTLTFFYQHGEKKDTLNSQEKRCLQVITEDYERGLLGTNVPIMDIVIRKLINSTTLSQFKPKPVNTQALDINPKTFKTYLDSFRARVEQLALNSEETRIMKEVMLPGLERLIDKEDEIVEHAASKFGDVYYLDEAQKLPLHTNHTTVASREDYRKTLHHLIASFFGAADIAHNATRLKVFCGKITTGYCFEGRVRGAFEWAASLSELVPFNELMQRYNEDYLSYAQIMLEQKEIQAAFIEPACAFIMARHNNMPCRADDDYAPDETITQVGVEKFLSEVLCYPSKQPILKIEELITLFENKSSEPTEFSKTSFWHDRSTQVVQAQIQALTALKKFWESALGITEAPAQGTVEAIKHAYEANWGNFDPRTKELFAQAEQASVHEPDNDNKFTP